MEGNTIVTSSNSYATIKQILLWWVIYILLDTLMFGILEYLHQVYVYPDSSKTLSDFSFIFFGGILGLVGKSIAIPQFLVMIVFLILRRKNLAFVKRRWLMIPIFCFFIAYCIFLTVTTLQNYSGSWSVAIDSLEREFRSWMSYKYPLPVVKLISVLSTLLATGPWLYLISRKWTTRF